MKRSVWLWPAVIICSSIVAGYIDLTNLNGTLRPIITMWFLFVCPGMTLVRFLRLHNTVAQWAIALALSLSIDAIVAGIQMYAGLWSPVVTLVILLCLCLSGSLIQVAMPRVASGRAPQ